MTFIDPIFILFLNFLNLIIGEFDEQNTELNFKEILSNFDYYLDDQHLWLNNKQRVNLKEVVVQIEETPFNVETVLRIVEMAANSLPYNAYSKGQLISKCLFGINRLTKKTKFWQGSLP